MKSRYGLAVSFVIVALASLMMMATYCSVSPVKADTLEPLNNRTLLAAIGHVTMLRVHDLGTGYGAGNDFLDDEVIIRLDTQTDKAFGFQLREDEFRPAREGMLNLLRDAFNQDWIVTINYLAEPDANNGEIIRVWLTKPVAE